MHSVQTIPTMHDPAKVYFTLVFFLLGILFLIYGPFAGYGRSIEFTVYDMPDRKHQTEDEIG